MASASLELTLAIIKPHAIKVPPVLQGIRKVILSNGFYVIRSQTITINPTMAEEFYSEHKEKFFYNRLMTMMSSGPSDVYILARENAISKWRELMGPTKVFKAKITHPDTIRGKYGLTDTRNAAHGSDSPESTRREIRILFPKFDPDEWYREDEPHFRNNKVIWDSKRFVHTRRK